MSVLVDIDPKLVVKHKLANFLHSLLLLSGMVVLLGFLGWSIAGEEGIKWMVVLGAIMLILGPRISPNIVLMLYGARPLSKEEIPALFDIVERLCERARLDYIPRLYYIQTSIPNAFTIGTRSNAIITVSAGLLEHLEFREIAGVIAHEISHIQNNDMWIMNLSDVISRLTSVFSLTGQLLFILNLPIIIITGYQIPWLPIFILIFAPVISMLLQLALSRAREFDADLGAAILTGDPEGLAMALAKMERYQSNLLSRIFFPGYKEPYPSLLRTHPETEERIKRLMSLVNKKPLFEALDGLTEYFVPEHLISTGQKPRWRIGGIWY
ncbi:MAG: peptidase M48 [Deltaproteobacteria bacterium]|nr:MAG: peptidase M48 [Deltaproteobacteria bacterium]